MNDWYFELVDYLNVGLRAKTVFYVVMAGRNIETL